MKTRKNPENKKNETQQTLQKPSKNLPKKKQPQKNTLQSFRPLFPPPNLFFPLASARAGRHSRPSLSRLVR